MLQLDMAGVDDVNREVEFQPMKGVPCDPRQMIAGHDEGLDGNWTSGFFDKGAIGRMDDDDDGDHDDGCGDDVVRFRVARALF